MSKMQCKCGHIISDVVCPSVTEATLIGDTAYDYFDRDFVGDVASFLDAIRGNRRSEWLAEAFGEIYPADLPDAEVISDLLSANFRKYAISAAECEHCGRLWLQQRVEVNSYRSFAPDDGGYGRQFAGAGGDSLRSGDCENATEKAMRPSGESAMS